MAGYYRKFCSNFATTTEPLTQSLSKKVKFVWSNPCEKAFEELKAMLQSAPVLTTPNFSSPFKLAVNASDVAAGAVLLQEDDGGMEHQVCHFSKKFNKSQMNYSITEKECLALVLAIQDFEIYVSSSSLPLVFYSDHNLFVFIHKCKAKSQRLLRWSLMLQEYVLDIRHAKGKDNVISDCLSRVQIFARMFTNFLFLKGEGVRSNCCCKYKLLEISRLLSHADMRIVELPRTVHQVTQLLRNATK